jgi:hypothetical protein
MESLSRSESRRIDNLQSNFQLEDLLAFYPPSDTPKIQTIFTAKEEFNELKASPSEDEPPKGEYFKHQKLVQRLMRAVDKLLILHEAGTGKTCTMISVSEFYEMMSRTLLGMTNSLLRQGFPIKKTYVLVRNDILKDEFLNQLVCVCSKANKYNTPYVKEAKDDRKMFRVKKEIERFYEVINYRDFSNKITKIVKKGFDEEGIPVYEEVRIMSPEQIKKEFSNCLFFADEIHNLRNVEGDFVDIKDEDSESSIINYKSLWTVFHTAINIKIMLATATPMINFTWDLVPTLNLLLPDNKQVKDKEDFAKWSLDEFEKLVRGMVSFIRVSDTGIDVVYEGRMIEGSILEVAGQEVQATTVINESFMSDFQSMTYLHAEKESGGGIRKAARHASNFVFPRKIIKNNVRETFKIGTERKDFGLYGREGFEEYVELVNNKYQFKKEFSSLMDKEGAFETMSQKFYDITKQLNEEEGNSFCFTDDFAKASGAVLLGLCLEKKYKYTRFEPSSAPIFKIVGQKSKATISSFCSKDTDENEEREVAIQKGKRYAILTSDTDKEKIRKMLTLFNSKENVNGEYIKIIIASRKAREGLNLANVQNIHLVNPSWNQSNMYQAIYRAIRATSHVELIKAKKLEAIERGEDPNKVRVIVKIHQHCSLLSDNEEVQEYSREQEIENYSVELQMYQLAEQKDRNNAVVMRMLKQCAIDCQINMERNKGRDTDQDGTQTCNYMDCDYECVDPAPLNLDFTTYDVYYKDELVEKIKEELLKLFEIKNQYTITEILKNINQYPTKFVIQGLSEMIKEKTPFLNRYGYTSFLAENGNLFFLINELNAYSTENIETLYQQDVTSLGKTEYNENLYGVGKRDFYDMTRMLRKPLDENKIKGILRSENVNLLEEVKQMDTNALITLIENLLIKRRTQPLVPQEISILDKYKKLIFELQEPLTLLENTKESLSKPLVPKRGRTRILDGTPKIKKLKSQIDVEMKYGEPVIVHILDLLMVDKAGYKTSTNFEKADANIRILKESEGQWRDTTNIEKLSYNQMIQNLIQNKMKEIFGDALIFGNILQDNLFRIIERNKNTDSYFGGKECGKSLTFQQLANLMYKLRLTPERFGLSFDENEIPTDVDELKEYVRSKKKGGYNTEGISKDQLIEIAKWMASNAVKENLCIYLQEYLESEGLLFRLIE